MANRHESIPSLKLAVISSDAAAASALSFAAERRGHQTVVLENMALLSQNLPFTPSIVIVAMRGAVGPELEQLSTVKSRFPTAGLFVTVEKPKEPFPREALKAGAYQVVREPYNPHELILGAERWLSDREATQPEDTVSVGDIAVALERYAAVKNGNELQLTKLELRLLFCLCQHSPNLTPLERLLTFGWDTLGDPDASLLKTHISHIRRKLADAGGTPFEITSRQTVGYVLRLV